MTSKLPLSGLNIVVTRPHEQALQLAQRIGQAGGKAVLFPLLEISPPENPHPLREVVSRLQEFELAIFISPNAVRYGIEAIHAEGEMPAHLKIATVGQGSAKALQNMGVRKIIAPEDRYDSEALLSLPQLQNVAGWHVVIFRGDGGRELLGDMLKARGAIVEYAECYRRSKPQQSVSVLFDASIDAITVTSSEALKYLWEMLEESGRGRLASAPLFVPHKRIAEAAQQMGWQNVIETAGGDDGLLSGLVGWAENRKSL